MSNTNTAAPYFEAAPVHAKSTTDWHITDAEGRILTDSLGCPMTLAILSQIVAMYPQARGVVSKNGVTLMAFERTIAQGGPQFDKLLSQPTTQAQVEAYDIYQAARAAGVEV